MKCPNSKCGYEGPGKFCQECGSSLVEDPPKSEHYVMCPGRLDDGSICNGKLTKSYKFCSKCGKSVDTLLFQQEKCINCQAVLLPDTIFCPYCGTKKAKEKETDEESGLPKENDTVTQDDNEGKSHETNNRKDIQETGKSEKESNHSSNTKQKHEEDDGTSETIKPDVSTHQRREAESLVETKNEDNSLTQDPLMEKNEVEKSTPQSICEETHQSSTEESRKNDTVSSGYMDLKQDQHEAVLEKPKPEVEETKNMHIVDTQPVSESLKNSNSGSQDDIEGVSNKIKQSAQGSSEEKDETQESAHIVPTSVSGETNTLSVGHMDKKHPQDIILAESEPEHNAKTSQPTRIATEIVDEKNGSNPGIQDIQETRKSEKESNHSSNTKQKHEEDDGTSETIKPDVSTHQLREAESPFETKNDNSLAQDPLMETNGVEKSTPQSICEETHQSSTKESLKNNDTDTQDNTEGVSNEIKQPAPESSEEKDDKQESAHHVPTSVSGETNTLSAGHMDKRQQQHEIIMAESKPENAKTSESTRTSTEIVNKKVNQQNTHEEQESQSAVETSGQSNDLNQTVHSCPSDTDGNSSSDVQTSSPGSLVNIVGNDPITHTNFQNKVGNEDMQKTTQTKSELTLKSETNAEKKEVHIPQNNTKEKSGNEVSENPTNKDTHQITETTCDAKKTNTEDELSLQKNGSNPGGSGGQTHILRQNTDEAEVHFHILLSPNFKFNKSTDKVVIRFQDGPSSLVNTTEDQWRLDYVQQHETSETEFHTKLFIQTNLMNDGKQLKYKYYVIRSEKKTHFEAYSFNGRMDTDNCRCLKLPDKWTSTSWHQYDGIVNEMTKSEQSVVGKAIQFAKNMIGNVPGHLKIDAETTMQLFSKRFIKDITQNTGCGETVSSLTRQLQCFLKGLLRIYVNDNKCWKTEMAMKKDVATYLLPPLYEHVDTFLPAKEDSESTFTRRMFSTLALVVVCNLLENTPETADMTRKSKICTSLIPHAGSDKSCKEMTFIQQNFPESRDVLKRSLVQFGKAFAKQRKDPSWMYLVPLIHFLSGECEPFAPVKFDLSHDEKEPVWWGIMSIGKDFFDKFKQQMKKWEIPLHTLINELYPVFSMDFLLPRTIMASLSLTEIKEAIESKTFPLEVSCAALIFHLRKNQKMYRHILDIESQVHDVMKCLSSMEVLRDGMSIDTGVEMTSLQMRVSLSAALVEEAVKTNRRYPVESGTDIFLHSFGILSFAGVKEVAKPLMAGKDSFARVNKMVLQWLNEYAGYFSANKLKDHIKFWNAVMKDEVAGCDAALTDAWNRNIAAQLAICLSKFVCEYGSDVKFVTFFCSRARNFKLCMQKSLNEIAFKVIGQTYGLDYSKFTDEARNRYGKLLCEMFTREWTVTFEDDYLLLDYCFTWTPLSHFIKLYNKGLKKHQWNILSEQCSEMIADIIATLEKTFKSLKSGRIHIRYIQLVNEHKKKFTELLNTCMNKNDNDTFESQVASIVEIRGKEIVAFERQATMMKTFAGLCQSLSSVDLAMLKQVLDKQTYLSEFCDPETLWTVNCPRDYQPTLTAFKVSEDLLDALPDIDRCSNSSIFIQMWQQRCEECNDSCSTLDDVITKVWRPVRIMWSDASVGIVEGNITFNEVGDLFGETLLHDSKLEEELRILCLPENLIYTRVKQLHHYRLSVRFAASANNFLQIKNMYDLQGSFQDIEKIANYDNQDLMIKDFDSSIIDSCDLHGMSDAQSQCLAAFSSSSRLVKWLKESMSTPGLKELKVFVDLALTSAGDEPLNIDKVQCLHSAVTGYAPLIFDLKKEDGYKQLLRNCKHVWKELEANRNLPKQLEDTNSQLEWLKQIKEYHGAVSVTSLSQAEAINADGIYRVGSAVHARMNLKYLNQMQAISLIVRGDKQSKEKPRAYTCEELLDLQSRLMLVAGKNHQGNESVERFIEVFDSITRLSQIYVKLHSAGCVLFKDWTAAFACDMKKPECAKIEFGDGILVGHRTNSEDIQFMIPKLASFMERCYTEWLQYIKDKRAKYMQLNYFTMDQLVILQQELVNISTDNEPSHLVYPLLSAVKSNCTKFDLMEAMEEAKAIITDAASRISEGASADEKTKHKEEVKINEFIREMEKSDFSESLARKALKSGITPDDIDDGLFWCMEHHKEEEEIDKGRGHAFESWIQSEVSMKSLISKRLIPVDRDNDLGVEQLLRNLRRLWSDFISLLSTNTSDYINLEHLAIILDCLSGKETRHIARKFPPNFSEGKPNLVICPQADVICTSLAIYMFDQDQPLPQPDETLLCSSETTVDEVDTFWRRALFNVGEKIYCLVNADVLDFDVSDESQHQLEEYLRLTYSTAKTKYRLVVICGSDNETHSHIVTSLLKYQRPTLPHKLDQIKGYIANKLRLGAISGVDEDSIQKSLPTEHIGSDSVRLIKSWRAGVGKTLYKVRMEERLAGLNPEMSSSDNVTIPLKDKTINHHYVVERLLEHTTQPDQKLTRIIHIDIAHEVQAGADFLLFNMLVLGYLMDKTGYVWRKSHLDLYLIETMPLMIRHGRDGVEQYVHQMLGILPEVICKSPQESLDLYGIDQDNSDQGQLFDEGNFKSVEFQRPYQYLCRLDEGRPLTDIQPESPEGTPKMCLQTLLRHCGVQDPSWAELNHFVGFLNTQLYDFEKNVFVGPAASEDLPGFAQFVLKFLIQMSRDFSTRSLDTNEETPSMTTIMGSDMVGITTIEEDNDEEMLRGYQLRRTWESSPHPYLFFTGDRSGFTFLGFYIDKRTGNLIDLQTEHVLQERIMAPKLYHALVTNRIPIQEDFDHLTRIKKIMKLCSVLGNDLPHDPDDTYELTTDNAKKIMAIFMRFRCNIPVIIMGETGCGKTRLVKFMCALQSPPGVEVNNMVLMKIHGGTTNADIIHKVNEAEQIAQQNVTAYGRNMYTVLFFDEANTTESIGLIKEIMCDRSMEGEKLELCDNLKMVAACNPYRKHPEGLIQKLEKAGLGYHIKADETTDKLGHVPMRRLVYRVQPLPHSLHSLIWDFGQLNVQVEELYIRQMVRRCIRAETLPDIEGLPEVVSSIVTASQTYMRSQEDACRFVSLRDVDRVLCVMSWFYEQTQKKRTLFNEIDTKLDDIEANQESIVKERKKKMNARPTLFRLLGEFASSGDDEEDEDDDEPRRINDITRALVLALGVCYHACLSTRNDYREYISDFFLEPCHLPGGGNQIEQEINVCQDVFLDNVQLERNIARNMALKENVFMMVICIELRIPLFLVGKPGSSKSLAKTIVSDAMQGNASERPLFQQFKQVQMVSFQCSPLSTPNGIVGTFKQCAQLQKDKDLKTFVSVVVLDEVGLAEDSPRMPLKTLHPLLEDGCQGNELPEPYKKVAFIGISNWALDPAKMNRGILVQRDVPDEDELCNTARGICASSNKKGRMEPLIKPLAKSYLDIFKEATQQMREFYGLRDFYSLVKMLSLFVERSKHQPTWHELVHSIKRNFGGMDHVDPVEIFRENICSIVTPEDHPQKGDPDCDTTALVQACLFDKNDMQSESRYLLLLTENYGALSILQQQILARQTDISPITIFGSSFRNDQEYTQICRNINKIKVCMETGNTVILLNLENLYESLYDALNQYYLYFGGERYVDLGLGTHRVKCLVHRKFRLIVVAEKQTVYKKFPIPLINRLEKHFLTSNTMLNDQQQQLVSELEQWANDFVKQPVFPKIRPETQTSLTIGDVFIGYHFDTCSAIILHVWESSAESQPTKESMMLEAKKMLLWCATPESEVRLENTKLSPTEQAKMSDFYHTQQNHDNIFVYLHQMIVEEKKAWLLSQVTTHSSLLATFHMQDISNATQIPMKNVVLLDTLTSFDTEQQFSKRVNQHFSSHLSSASLLIIQCDSGDVNADLVACARYCVMDEYEKAREMFQSPAHIVFIVKLPRIAGGCFSGFQGGKWHSAHIDELYSTDLQLPPVQDMQDKSVATLVGDALEYRNTFEVDGRLFAVQSEPVTSEENESVHITTTVDTQDVTTQSEIEVRRCQDEGRSSVEMWDTKTLDVKGLILQSLHAALSMVKDTQVLGDRATNRVGLLLTLLHKSTNTGELSFLKGLTKLIHKLLKEKESKVGGSLITKKWLNIEVARQENMQKAGTFRRACLRTLEAKIAPILAGVIAHLDTNQNLDLVSDEAEPWLCHLWRSIINSPEAVSLEFTDLLSPLRESDLPEFIVKATGRGGHFFKPMMPFSWEICELVDKLISQLGTHENGSDVVTNSLRNTKLGSVLKENIAHENVDASYNRYLNDFVHFKYNAASDEEHKLVYDAIDIDIQGTKSEEVDDNERTVLQMIVRIHESFNKQSQFMNCFRMVNTVWSDCSVAYTELRKEKPDTFVVKSYLPFAAVYLLTEKLSPEKNELNEPTLRNSWLNRVYKYRPVIESVFKMYANLSQTVGCCNNSRNCMERTRQLWNRVVIVKLFLEHVCAGEVKEEMITIKYCMPLWKILGEEADMKKERTLHGVEKFLKLCHTTALKTYRGEGNEKLGSYQRSCNTFFMDVVSQLCFTENIPPSDDVITKLLSYITSSLQSGTCVLDTGLVPTPVFKSFLLQHLLRTSDEHTLLRQLLEQAEKVSTESGCDQKKTSEEHQHNYIQLCLLVIQCLEDLNKDRAKEDDIKSATLALQHCQEHICEEGLTVNKLLSLAEARMGLVVAARCIKNSLDKEPNSSSRALIEVASSLCTSTDTTWPLTYLVKYICRDYGIDVYQNICNGAVYHWLDQSDLEGQVPDMYLVLGDGYTALRESLSKVVQGNDVKVLAKIYQRLKKNARDACHVDLMLQLAIYREITCSNRCHPRQRTVSDKIVISIDGFTKKYTTKQTELTERILHNTLSDRLTVRQCEDFHTQGIQCLLVHYLCILSHLQEDQSLMQPLIGMMKHPQNFANAFIPSMPQDNLVDIKEALIAAKTDEENQVIYRCPNGHPYVIGNCGRPYHLGKCKWCGEDIGGKSGRLYEGNTEYQSVDETRRGHILGPAASRQGASSERTLTPVQCASIRLFTHMSLYLACLQHADQMEELFKPTQTDIPGFLWDHITADLVDLQQIFERSNDDVLILMHSIMATFMDQNELEDVLDQEVCTLSSKTGRAKWEQLFSDNILQPVLQTADSIIETNYQLLVNGTILGGNLLCLLYEKGTVDQIVGVDMLQEVPAVWRYRIPISLTHLKQEVDNNTPIGRDGQKQHKVLHGFLEYEPILRALRYIPSILKLQRGLLQKYQRRLDKAEALTITIRDIMKDKTLGDDTEHLLENFKAAWDIVRVHLEKYACSSQHGDVWLAEEYCSRRLDERTPISALLPSNKEAGLCSYVLIDFLLRKQNEFIDSYLGVSLSKGSSMTYTVSPAEVTSAHLISFDPQNDLLPLIHANCQYSFEIGKGTKIEYDFTSLERQLKDRLLFSKPRIDIGKYLQIELMVYRTEFTNAAVLAELADKITQTTLSAAVKSQICLEMRSLPELCQSMDRLDIAISFLKSIGGAPTTLLTHFMEETLQMPVTFHSQKAQQNCEFQHARSLWLLFAMQRSKLMFQNRTSKQNIFESVHPHYLEEIPCLERCQEYLKNLTVERLSPFVEVLHEFILLVVAKPQNIEDDNRRKTLGIYLQAYADGMECSNMDSVMLSGLSEDVLFIHSVHLWIMACRQLIHKQTGQMIDIQ